MKTTTTAFLSRKSASDRGRPVTSSRVKAATLRGGAALSRPAAGSGPVRRENPRTSPGTRRRRRRMRDPQDKGAGGSSFLPRDAPRGFGGVRAVAAGGGRLGELLGQNERVAAAAGV